MVGGGVGQPDNKGWAGGGTGQPGNGGFEGLQECITPTVRCCTCHCAVVTVLCVLHKCDYEVVPVTLVSNNKCIF